MNPDGVFETELAEYTESVEASKEVMLRHGPMSVIAGSGMLESGWILPHLPPGASDLRNMILIVGFMFAHTLGRRIIEMQAQIKTYVEMVDLRARVGVLDSYSADSDRRALASWCAERQRTSPRLVHTWLVHGEPAAQDALAASVPPRDVAMSCPTTGDHGTIVAQ